jgi:hypothetical protein
MNNSGYRNGRLIYPTSAVDHKKTSEDQIDLFKSTIPAINENLDALNNAGFITKSVDDLTNYYLKSETYTKAEVAALIGAIQQFHYEIYASTSDVTTPANNVLYLIGPASVSGGDKYEEYVYANNTFVKIGDTSIDLSGYVTITALNTALADYTTTANLTALLSDKVSSTSVRTIVTLTQADYNALATKDANTEYNII